MADLDPEIYRMLLESGGDIAANQNKLQQQQAMSKLLGDTGSGLGANGPKIGLSTGGTYQAAAPLWASVAGGLAKGAEGYQTGQMGTTQGAIDSARALQNQKTLAAIIAANNPSAGPRSRANVSDSMYSEYQ